MEQITITSIINEQFNGKSNDSGAFSPINVTDISQSTPIKTDATKAIESYATPKFVTKSDAQSTPISAYRPKVNFHSIADLASPCNESGYSSNDSAMLSMNYCTPKATDTEKSKDENRKPIRTSFSDFQKQQLEVYFQHNPYPDPRETEELSAKLGLGEAVIKVWFQNKRSRDKQRKFSHANRAAMRAALNAQQNKENVKAQYATSPIFNNIQMLTSRINQYHSAMSAIQNQRTFF